MAAVFSFYAPAVWLLRKLRYVGGTPSDEA